MRDRVVANLEQKTIAREIKVFDTKQVVTSIKQLPSLRLSQPYILLLEYYGSHNPFLWMNENHHYDSVVVTLFFLREQMYIYIYIYIFDTLRTSLHIYISSYTLSESLSFSDIAALQYSCFEI